MNRNIFRKKSRQALALSAVPLIAFGTSFAAMPTPAEADTTEAPPVVNGSVQVFAAAQLEYIDQNQTAPISPGSSTNYLNANIELEADIAIDPGFQWTPIGGNTFSGFTGTFNGQGHEISGLDTGDSTLHDVGFIGKLASQGEIEHLGVSSEVSGGYNVAAGGLVGEQDGGTITDSSASGTVNGSGDSSWVGGLVGYQGGGTIVDSYATSTAIASGNQSGDGGLVGWQASGSITNAHATGSVQQSGTNGSTGGLVGMQAGNITGSYATGDVTGSWYDGGLVGYQGGGTLARSYATGTVSGGWHNGGLVGHQQGGTITESYATNAVNGGPSSYNGGLVGQQWGKMVNVYAMGPVTGGGSSQVGGVTGNLYGGTITDAYAVGSVSAANSTTGGLVGLNQNGGTIVDSVFDKNTTKQTAGVGMVAPGSTSGGTAETTSAMQQIATYTTVEPAGVMNTAWDFTNTWGIDPNINNGYPYLREFNSHPTTQPTMTGKLGNNGWYVGPVQLSLAATDNNDGVAATYYSTDGANWQTYTSPISFSNDGKYSIEYYSVDNAGNQETPQTVSFSIDQTPPTITTTSGATSTTYASNTSGVQFTLGQAVTWTAKDNLSGVQGPTSGTINTSSIGTHPITVTDYAGNTTTLTYSVVHKYNFGGFLPPINDDGSSVFKLGRTVPVKFQLTDANRNFVSNAIANISVTAIGSSTSDEPLAVVSTSAATIGTLFRYDSTSNQYIFNLRTEGLTSGTQYMISVTLDDGTTYTVLITIK